jgi:hypothetical protein
MPVGLLLAQQIFLRAMDGLRDLGVAGGVRLLQIGPCAWQRNYVRGPFHDVDLGLVDPLTAQSL